MRDWRNEVPCEFRISCIWATISKLILTRPPRGKGKERNPRYIASWQLQCAFFLALRSGLGGWIYEGIRRLLVNNEVFIWNCASWKSPLLFRVSPEIYEHPEETAVSAARDPKRRGRRRWGWLSVILAFLEESNNDFSPLGLTLCIHH